jgi:hypothetical protein
MGPAAALDPGPLGRGSVTDRLVRLDRLVDLLDGARFAGDQRARDRLWASLGGHATGVGHAATRDATLLLLQEALELESQELEGEARTYVADLIMLLSADLELPETAEDLSIQTLAYRQVAADGHPRVADNARWRLYDHVQGCLRGATSGDPERRLEVAVHALYAEEDDISPLLADTAPHARPPWPGVDALWSRLEAVRDPLAELPRWAPVVQARRKTDQGLHQTLLATLPAPRDSGWPLARLETGTARAESLAPVVLVQEEAVVVDAGRPQARKVPLHQLQARLAPALGDALAQDGRGVVLLAAPALTRSPVLHATLGAAARGGVTRLELGALEPRLDPSEGDVVVALPLEITSGHAPGPEDRAIEGARVRVHLEGRGAHLATDGTWITEAPVGATQLRARLAELSRAYPRETVLALSLAPDVVYLQLFELLSAAMGGEERPFMAVGWIPGAEPPPAGERSAAALERRLALSPATRDLEQPYPLRAGDQARVERLGDQATACLPEWDGPLPRSGSVPVQVVFDGGRATDLSLDLPRRARGDRDAVLTCVREAAYGMQLREHTDRLTITIRLRPAAQK